jgi:hypothetical protein
MWPKFRVLLELKQVVRRVTILLEKFNDTRATLSLFRVYRPVFHIPP